MSERASPPPVTSTPSVTLSLAAGVAVVTIDAPRANAAPQAAWADLMAALDAAEAAKPTRVVLAGTRGVFIAGPDALAFDAAPPEPRLPEPRMPEVGMPEPGLREPGLREPGVPDPGLPEVAARIGGFPVPVVAAIEGRALGGGLELALACRMRIAAPGATLGLPETTLGGVSGAGGTQLLPRLIGLAPALDLIAEGRTVGAAEAARLGLVDALAEDPVALARTAPLPDRPVTGARPAPAADPEAVEGALRRAARRAPGQEAPRAAIALVEAAARLPLAEGLALERETFLRLGASDQAAALRHVARAERAAQGRGGADGTEIASGVVVGGGTMGAGIAYALARIGVKVALVEMDAAGAERARANVGKLYAEAVARGKTTSSAAAAEQAERLDFRIGYDALPPADIAIEAAFENLDVKRAVFAALDAALPETAILATNTSYLDVNAIATGIRSPGRFLGLHFFSPAHLMRLLEVVKGRDTAPSTLAAALRLAARLGKIPVPAGVCDGFIGNRILTRYRQICDVTLIEGALPAEVDGALRGFGMAMGPYEVQDLSGLDIAYANRKRLGWRTKPGFRYVPIADRIVEETGRLGRKTGAGWYDYAPAPASSAVIDAIVVEESARAGLTRRAFTEAEIVERAVMAMIEEGVRILEDGIAERASDIDLVMVHGYGFPRWRGGPMHYAERVGLAAVRDRIAALAAADPLSWAVPGLLARAADQGCGLDEAREIHG